MTREQRRKFEKMAHDMNLTLDEVNALYHKLYEQAQKRSLKRRPKGHSPHPEWPGDAG